MLPKSWNYITQSKGNFKSTSFPVPTLRFLLAQTACFNRIKSQTLADFSYLVTNYRKDFFDGFIMLKSACGSAGISQQPAFSLPSLSNHSWLANFKWQSYLGAAWLLTYLTYSTSWSHLVAINTCFSSDNYVIFFFFAACLVRKAKRRINSRGKREQGLRNRFLGARYTLLPLEKPFNFIHIQSRTFIFLNSKLIL